MRIITVVTVANAIFCVLKTNELRQFCAFRTHLLVLERWDRLQYGNLI